MPEGIYLKLSGLLARESMIYLPEHPLPSGGGAVFVP